MQLELSDEQLTGKKVPRKHLFRGIFAPGCKDSNLEMTELLLCS